MQYIIDNYKTLLAHIDELIKYSGYKIEFLSKSLGLSREAFYQKRKKHSFTVEEMEKLLGYIDNEELEDKLFGKHLDLVVKEERLSEEATKKLFSR